MQQQPSSATNITAGLINPAIQPAIAPSSPWSVTALEVVSGHKLKVTFADGLSGIVDISTLVNSEQAGVFARLRDEALFREAFIAYGAVTWPEQNGLPPLDLAPDAMHKAIAQSGKWVL